MWEVLAWLKFRVSLSFAQAVELSLVGHATPDRSHCIASMDPIYLLSIVPAVFSVLGTLDTALGATHRLTRWLLTVSSVFL